MEGSTIIVTGGEEGLGYEIVKQLAPKHRVVVFGVKQDRLDAVSAELGCGAVLCDVTDPERVELAVAAVMAEYGRIDCLVNNAGIFAQGALEDHTVEKIGAVLAVNTVGTILMSRAVIPHMKSAHAGTIINIISQSGLNPRPNWSVYAASKWAVTGLTRSLAEELREHGVRVTGIYPSRLKTKLFDNAGVSRDLGDALDPIEVARSIEFILSLDPTTEVTEIGLRSTDMEL